MLGASLIAVLLTIAIGATAVGTAVVARHRAQSGADLAALAAAGAAPAGAVVACARAGAVLAAMRMHLDGCRLDELDVVVAVVAPARLGRWHLGTARATARAGPTEIAY